MQLSLNILQESQNYLRKGLYAFFWNTVTSSIGPTLKHCNDPLMPCCFKGTSQTNTVCEKCAEGYFSSSSSALDSCVNHQECATGQILLLNGSINHDTVCGTCEDFANGGLYFAQFILNAPKNWIIRFVGCTTAYNKVWFQTHAGQFPFSGESYRKCLSGFFSMHKMRTAKMKRFVDRWAAMFLIPLCKSLQLLLSRASFFFFYDSLHLFIHLRHGC